MAEAMTEEKAWEVYDSQAGKQGRPSKEFTEAKSWLTAKGLLKEDAQSEGANGDKKQDKKPPIIMERIKEPYSTPMSQRIEIYEEALKYMESKRNFVFQYFLTAKYGLTQKVCTIWERESDELAAIRTIASELQEQKLLDSINDKWGHGNPLGNLFALKAIYGYNDRGDGGQLVVDGDIEIQANTTDDDFDSMDYDDGVGYDED